MKKIGLIITILHKKSTLSCFVFRPPIIVGKMCLILLLSYVHCNFVDLPSCRNDQRIYSFPINWPVLGKPVLELAIRGPWKPHWPLLLKGYATITHLTEQLSHSGTEEAECLEVKLWKEKEKSKRMWQMNCRQAAEQEELLGGKDTEIARLRCCLLDLKTAIGESSDSSSSPSHGSHSTHSPWQCTVPT